MSRALVVCAGNELVADDGVGPAVYRRLHEKTWPEGVAVESIGLIGVGLLEFCDAQDMLIVVDASRNGCAPGTLDIRDGRAKAPLHRAVSAHGIGITETLVLGDCLYPERMPKQTLVVTVEGACFDQIGIGLTPVVEQAAKEAAAAVERILDGFGGSDGAET